jgi:16S rRNA (adenine1518-N6/adenine1519-N6)-dimethyltransferase
MKQDRHQPHPGPRHRPRRRFGQHFLEPAWADKVVEAIAPAPEDQFVEIGPGAGALTVRLAPRVRRLTSFEIDRDLAMRLQPALPGNAEVIAGDFLDADLAAFVSTGSLRIAGNLPYNISSPILFKLLESARRLRGIRDATLMLQEEVADRLTAAVGTKEYGVLTIYTGLQADVSRLLVIPPGAFRPAPRVHSALVRLAFRPPRVEVAAPRTFDRMVRAIYTQRRKTLLNALRPVAHALGRDPVSALSAADIDGNRRPETLALPELARLANVLDA